MVVKILADCGIIGADSTQVSEVFHCVQVGAIDADVRRIVCHTWKGLVQHLSLRQADGRPKFLAASEKRLIMCVRIPPCGREGRSR